MIFAPGDEVIPRGYKDGIPKGVIGVVQSRNMWTCTVSFSFVPGREIKKSYYEHELDYPNAQADQWDEQLRGSKMSNNSGKVIYKYQMPVQEKFSMELPKDAQILRVADQDGMFWLWAVVDTRAPDEERNFIAIKCGANIPEDRILNYIGMCAIFVQQELALYIFEDQGKY